MTTVTVKELKAICRKEGLTGYSCYKRKADLIKFMKSEGVLTTSPKSNRKRSSPPKPKPKSIKRSSPPKNTGGFELQTLPISKNDFNKVNKLIPDLSEKKNVFRVVTYNVQEWTPDDIIKYYRSHKDIMGVIETLNPDVLGLQETSTDKVSKAQHTYLEKKYSKGLCEADTGDKTGDTVDTVVLHNGLFLKDKVFKQSRRS